MSSGVDSLGHRGAPRVSTSTPTSYFRGIILIQIRIDYYINSCAFLYPISSILAVSSAVQPYTVLIREDSVGG